MNTDIRLSTEFFRHPKTLKLKRRLGLEGIFSLQQLWVWVAQNRPNGNLAGLDTEDIALAACWEGDEATFVQTLIDLRWLDVLEDASLCLHNWNQYQQHLLTNESRQRELDIPWSKWRLLRQQVFERDGYVCQYCGCLIASPHCDHVVPLSRGGRSTLDNLVTACPSCNCSKHDKTPEEWRATNGR